MQAEDVIVHQEHDFVVMLWLTNCMKYLEMKILCATRGILLGVPKRCVRLDGSANTILAPESGFEEWGIVGVAIMYPFHALQKSLFDYGVEVDQIESLLIVVQQGEMPHLFFIVKAEVSIVSLHRVRARIEFLLHSKVPMEIFLNLSPHHLETYLVSQPLGKSVIVVSDIVSSQVMGQLRIWHRFVFFTERSVRFHKLLIFLRLPELATQLRLFEGVSTASLSRTVVSA